MPSPESAIIRKAIHKEPIPSGLSIQVQREEWIAYAKTQRIAAEIILKEDEIADIPCLWVSKSGCGKGSTILYVHGGGLVDGGIITHREFVSRLVKLTGYKALMIEYRLIPEHPYPSPLEDVLAVYEHLIESGMTQPKRIALGGDSSGGGLVVAAMIRMRERGTELPSCAFTISGTFDMTLSSPSMSSRDEIDPCLSRASLTDWLKYFHNIPDLSDPSISPLFGDLHGLPPVLLQVGDHEVWLDDSKRITAKIHDVGGEAELRVWKSMWHVWHMYAELPEAQKAIIEIGAFLERRIT